MKSSEDEYWMQQALREARKGTGLTSPNPAVGAILVRNGEEIARGRTQKVGGNHAERDALSGLEKGEAKGATIYVTLEPCSTQGRSGACTEALMEAGVARVVYGIVDPNPAHAGKADAILSSAGIEVKRGICVEDCEFQIRGFSSVQTRRRPWVIAKTAMSLDGRISRPPHEGQWLSNEQSREHVQILRGEVDAIVTSGETVRRDDPSLTIRSERVAADKIQPLRIILSRKGLDGEKWKLFNDDFSHRTQLIQGKEISKVLTELSSNEGVNTVLLECGGQMMGEFLDAGLIDEMVVFYAPLVTGGPHPSMGGEGILELEKSWEIVNSHLTRFGDDLCLRGLLRKNDKRKLER